MNCENKKDITIKFLGSGSAFTLSEENYQSNIAIIVNDKIMLFDFGTTILEALKYSNIELKDINTLYGSHCHADHIGGGEALGFNSYFNPNIPKYRLVGNSEVLEMLWDHSLSGGMRSLQNTRTTLETYFDTEYIDNNGHFFFEKLRFNLLQTYHVQDDRRIVPSYGLTFDCNGVKVLITGDTQYNGQLLSFYQDCDMIFHDVEFSDYQGSVHAQYRELKTLPTLIKRKMYLYHYSLNGKSFEELEAEVLTDGFGGLVARGQEFII